MNKRRMISVTGIAVMLAMMFFACKEEVPVSGVTLDKTALTLTLEEAVLKATVEPANATVQTVTWSAEPAGVVTLKADGNSCTLAYAGDGTATVTVKTADGGKTAQCRVTAAEALTNLALIEAVEQATGIDWTKEKDGKVKLTAENLKAIRAVTKLSISDQKLTDLSGIEWFTGLTTLWCYSNQLTELDVSANTALEGLECYDNQLTELDVSSNTALTKLYCYNNQLTELDVSANTALKTLYCDSNQLTELDVSANTALTQLYCYLNRLTTLDVSANTALTKLYCYSNQLTELNVSANTALQILQCYDNQLTSLNVSANTALEGLECYDNQLTELDVSSNTALEWLYCYSNRLASLNVSGCTALQTLSCWGNQLTTLDVSANTALTDLMCGGQTSDGTTAQRLTLTLTSDQKTKWDRVWSANNKGVDVEVK